MLSVMLTACQLDDGDSSQSTIVNVGDEVPAFSLTGKSGEVLSSASLSGQIYLLSFFDTGCRDCQQEFPVLQQIYEKYKGVVSVMNVPRSQTLDEVEAYWSEHGLSMPYYMASDSRLYYKFATRVIPRTYIVDREGRVQALFTDSPVASYEAIDDKLQDLLAMDPGVSMSLKIKVSAGRRAGEEHYFQNEHVISRLDVLFFNAETKKFMQKITLNNLVKAEDDLSQVYDITYIVNSLRVKVGKVNIFAIANYHQLPEEITDQDAFLNMVDSITYDEGISSSIPLTGPVMTNRATSLLSVDLVPYNNKVYLLTLEMERVMAKLRLGILQNTFELKNGNNKYAEVHITNYKFVNLNKRYYLFQHKDHEVTQGQQPVFKLPEHFDDYTESADEYIVDPYFYQKTASEESVKKFADRYVSWYGQFTTENFASMPAAGSYAYAYILENTVFKDCQKNGYSPGIVLKAAVSPTAVLIYDNAERKLIEESRPEYWPQKIYLHKHKFYGSIQAVNIGTGMKLDELQDYTDSQLKAYGIKQCKYNMGVYETYYTYWIQHRTNYADEMGPMKFGVVRNNFYNMIVTGVSGIGNSVITPEVLRDNYPNSYSDVIVN